MQGVSGYHKMGTATVFFSLIRNRVPLPSAGASSTRANMAAIDSPTHSKGEAVFGATDNGTHVSENEFKEEVGGLQFDQYLTGGLGRHLGIFSTTSLM